MPTYGTFTHVCKFCTKEIVLRVKSQVLTIEKKKKFTHKQNNAKDTIG